MKRLLPLLLLAAGGIGASIPPAAVAAENKSMVVVGPADFASAAPPSETARTAHVARFELDVLPVTNAQFLQFVRQHPEWRRDRVSALFADENYLAHWAAPDTLADAVQARQPVVNLSWFAADAYCAARGARLPRWYEWELTAAADATHPDTRADEQWRQRILNWYSNPSAGPLAAVGKDAPNYYGVRDLHGLIWEWVEDFNSLLVGADNREQGGADKLEFCGAGSLSLEQKENYAVLMRVAMLSSLQARFTTKNLGFRCARDAVETKP
ncbi:MAG TPA: formylglycine-generating enzyme family protein [Gammaproteobacteria bacterium]|nr:formylglycine-generating enzyme family protein [Gammaproteobacteria bacterium]